MSQPQQPYNRIAHFTFPDGSVMRSALFSGHPDMVLQDLQDGDVVGYDLSQKQWTNRRASQASSVDGGSF